MPPRRSTRSQSVEIEGAVPEKAPIPSSAKRKRTAKAARVQDENLTNTEDALASPSATPRRTIQAHGKQRGSSTATRPLKDREESLSDIGEAKSSEGEGVTMKPPTKKRKSTSPEEGEGVGETPKPFRRSNGITLPVDCACLSHRLRF